MANCQLCGQKVLPDHDLAVLIENLGSGNAGSLPTGHQHIFSVPEVCNGTPCVVDAIINNDAASAFGVAPWKFRKAMEDTENTF